MRKPNHRLLARAMMDMPAIGCWALTVHVGLLLLGVNLPVAEFVVVVAFDALLYILSREFRLCLLHRCLVFYIAAMFTCMFLQKLDVFGNSLNYFRWGMFVTGVVLSLWAIIKNPRNRECCNGEEIDSD